MKKVIRLTESELVKLVKKVIKEEEEQEAISQIENNPTASDAAESVESLSQEEQEYLANFIKRNPDGFKKLVQKELKSQQSNKLTEEDDDEKEMPMKKSFEDEYGMSRKEFDIRKLIQKIVGYTAVGAGLATLPAAALISGGVAAGLGVTALVGYLLKDAAFYQKNDRFQYGSGQQKGGINYKASDLADYEDSMTESYIRKKVTRLSESDFNRIVRRVVNESSKDDKESMMKKIMRKLKGISDDQLKYNIDNNLPWDWNGTKEGYYEKMEPRRKNAGSN